MLIESICLAMSSIVDQFIQCCESMACVLDYKVLK